MIISHNDNPVQNNCDSLNYPNNHQNTLKVSDKKQNCSETQWNKFNLTFCWEKSTAQIKD